MSVTVATTGTQTLTDSTSTTTPFVRAVTGSYTGLASSVAQQVLIPNAPTSITLPISPVNFVYVKNLSGTATITVTWTPNGGASNVVVTLQPGSYVELVETAAGSGITALSLQASVASTPVEYLLVG